MAVRQMSKLNL